MPQNKKGKSNRPYFFVSYSSREPQVLGLLPCLWIAFSEQFDMKLTPSALESGASQLDQISSLIRKCSFAVVILDGLRPNVVFELGILHNQEVPSILIKGKNARVDIQSLVGTAGGGTKVPDLNIDVHFSDVKDLNYLIWDPTDPAAATRQLWQDYCKKKSKIKNLPNLKEPMLWQ